MLLILPKSHQKSNQNYQQNWEFGYVTEINTLISYSIKSVMLFIGKEIIVRLITWRLFAFPFEMIFVVSFSCSTVLFYLYVPIMRQIVNNERIVVFLLFQCEN